MAERLTFWLEELSRKDAPQVGQKCALLGEMLQAGLPVPPGFVLSIPALQKFLSETGAGEKIADYLRQLGEGLKDLQLAEEASRHIGELFMAEEIPGQIRQEVEVSYRELSKRRGVGELPLSIRSSGPVSRPGLFDTYLNVRGLPELMRRIKSCWASAFSPRAIATRAQEGRPDQVELIAVGVQAMIQARSAGVLFTADPVTGDPSVIVIEASWGLGEGIAQARTNPDRYVLDKQTLKIKQRNIAPKTCEVVASEQGTLVREVPSERQTIPCLSEEELVELAQLARSVEEHFGGVPQDIEWASDASLPSPGNIFLIQTRPAVLRPAKDRISKPADKDDAEHIVDLLIEHFYR